MSSYKNPEKPIEYNPYSFMNRLCVEKIPIRSQFYQPRTDIKEVKKLEFQLISQEKFMISGSFHVHEEKMKAFFKNMNGTFIFSEKAWIFPLSELKTLASSIKASFPEFLLVEIPLFVFEAIKPIGFFLEIDSSFAIVFEAEDDKKTLETLPENIRESLYPFQRKNLENAIKHKARFLLFDEYGMGKSLQSLSLAFLYQDFWPLLIIIPHFLDNFWQEEILRFFNSSEKPEIQVFSGFSNKISKTAKILIFPYEIAAKNIEKLQDLKPQFVICDEIGPFANQKSNISKILMPFLQKIKHLVLISSPISLESPKDFFPALQLLRPAVFKDFRLFVERYCEIKQSNFGLGCEYCGYRNSQELKVLLNALGFSRKRKNEYMLELKEKNRKIINLTIENHSKNSTFGREKLRVMKEYLKFLMNCETKIVLFLETEEIRLEIANFLKKNNTRFVEFEAKISRSLFPENHKVFQENDLYKIAMVSYEVIREIETFQMVSLGVFLEIPEKKENLWLAEGKLSMNQNKIFNFHYLIAKNTIEEKIFEDFINIYEGNLIFDEKKPGFLEFLKGDEKKEEEEKGVIENLDKIEELIKEWENEREMKKMEKKKKNKRKLKEIVECGSSGDEVLEIDAQGKNVMKKSHLNNCIMIVE